MTNGILSRTELTVAGFRVLGAVLLVYSLAEICGAMTMLPQFSQPGVRDIFIQGLISEGIRGSLGLLLAVSAPPLVDWFERKDARMGYGSDRGSA